MANPEVFSRAATAVRALPVATTTNDAGGTAYTAEAHAALATYACTGTFHGTFYASAEDHLTRLQNLLGRVDDLEFVARTAVYAREHGRMKDVPAFLLAYVFARDTAGHLFARAFPRVVDSGKMACTWWQIVRSGAAGRRGLGQRGKRAVARWLDDLTDDQVFRASIGTSSPSLVDVIRVTHPVPATPSRRALYGYLSGRNRADHPVRNADLPQLVQEVEAFKADPARSPLPDVPFLLLSSLPLTRSHWATIAARAPWHTLRMNLNTFLRHGVFEDPTAVAQAAAKLADPAAVRASRAFPYQIMAAHRHVDAAMPEPITRALHAAMEVAVSNVPQLPGRIVVCPDVSGSMGHPITGARGSGTSKLACVDIAALVSAAILRRNHGATLLPFDTVVRAPESLDITPDMPVLDLAAAIRAACGGGTDCGAPLRALNAHRALVDLVILVSDNESWSHYGAAKRVPSLAAEWAVLADRNPRARLVCIDVAPRVTTQVVESDPRVLHVGGFGDEVFEVLASFVTEDDPAAARDHWIRKIASVEL